jgi:hypothetical protein
MKTTSTPFHTLLTTLLLAVSIVPALSQTTVTWTNTAGGLFSAPGNWNPNQVPGAADTAVFNLNANYTVNWTATVTNREFRVDKGSVTFDLGGHTYWFVVENNVTVGSVGNTTSLLITNGAIDRIKGAVYKYYIIQGGNDTTVRIIDADVNVDYIRLFNTTGSTGQRMEVIGPRAILRHTDGGGASIGHLSDGVLVFTNGARSTLRNTEIKLGELVATGADTFCGIQRISLGGSYNADPTLQTGYGRLTITDGATARQSASSGNSRLYLFTNSVVRLQNGTLELYTSTTEFYCRGLLEGSGTIRGRIENHRGGRIVVGGKQRVGLLAVTGACYNHDPANSSQAGSLAFELGGPLPADHDRVMVNGLFSAGGTLRVSLLNGYRPSYGDRFDLINWSSTAGTFAIIDLPGRPDDWDISDLYATGEIAYVRPSGTVMMIQ